LNNEISLHAPVRLVRCRPTAHPYGLRLCRSAPAGSFPPPPVSIAMINSRNTGENSLIRRRMPARLQLIQRLSRRCTRGSLCRMLDRSVSCNDRFAVTRRARFRWDKRS